MIVDVEPRQGRWSRLLLLAGGVGLAWCAIATFGQSSSASAAEGEPDGLLGAVTSTVQQTTSAATSVIDSVEPVVIDVVHVVAPPASAPAPASAAHAPVVAPIAHHVATAATTAVSGVADTATSTLQGTAQTVDAVSSAVADVTSAVVSRVSAEEALAPLLSAIEDLPVLGAAVDRLGVTDAAGHVVGGIDELLTAIGGSAATVIGSPGQTVDGILPGVLLPTDDTQPIPVAPAEVSFASPNEQQTLIFGGLFAGALMVGTIVPVASASGIASGRWGGAPFTPSAPAGAPGLVSAAASAAATLWAALVEFSWRAHQLGGATLSLSDDALPGAPVFATDVSPD